MKELRDIKLDLLMGNQNPIIDLFNKITNDLKIINTNVYNDDGLEFIYYQPSTNEWIFFQDAKNDNFWCNFATYWSFFEYKIGLEYLEIQAITKYLVEEALKREVATPKCWKNNISRQVVEEALKREVATPPTPIAKFTSVVEEALKREVATPDGIGSSSLPSVEEALKREVTTPSTAQVIHFRKVEDALKREISKPKPEIHKMDSMVLNALKRDTEKE